MAAGVRIIRRNNKYPQNWTTFLATNFVATSHKIDSIPGFSKELEMLWLRNVVRMNVPPILERTEHSLSNPRCSKRTCGVCKVASYGKWQTCVVTTSL
jgi:hypothetical protein